MQSELAKALCESAKYRGLYEVLRDENEEEQILKNVLGTHATVDMLVKLVFNAYFWCMVNKYERKRCVYENKYTFDEVGIWFTISALCANLRKKNNS